MWLALSTIALACDLAVVDGDALKIGVAEDTTELAWELFVEAPGGERLWSVYTHYAAQSAPEPIPNNTVGRVRVVVAHPFEGRVYVVHMDRGVVTTIDGSLEGWLGCGDSVVVQTISPTQRLQTRIDLESGAFTQVEVSKQALRGCEAKLLRLAAP